MDRPSRGGQELTPHAELRLFCLPYAGGSAVAFQSWKRLAPRQIEVHPLELPGRGTRGREAPLRRLAPLVRELANTVEASLDRPYALFGHSLGGLVAFELARDLRARGCPAPEHLFVSATAAPGTPRTWPLIHCAPDAAVKQELRVLGGTPPELLDNDELMELVLPVLRADFSVIETYEYREEPPLAVPITVFGGRSDPVVTPASLAGWRQHSSAACRLRLFPGGHFFVHSATADLVATVAGLLRPTVDRSAGALRR